jgi:uncharacterized protein (TIGR03437 family)
MGLVQGLLCSLLLAASSTGAAAARHPVPFGKPDPGGVLRQFAIASFAATGQTSIQATTADAFGNVYVTGTTNAFDFPVKNAAQPVFGDARILRSTDLGATWKPAGSPPADVTAIMPDPVAPQVLFAGGSSGIYKSSDGGATWRQVYTFTGSFPFSSAYLAIDPGNHLRLAATVPNTNVLIRLDGGETWASTGNSGSTLTADPTGSGALISGSSISRDWGATFQRLTPPGAGLVSTVAFDPSHRGWIYLGQAAGVQGSFSLSTDFGATWTAKASPNDTFSAMNAVVVDPANPGTLVATTPDGLFVSTDGAASWTGPRRSLNLNALTPLLLLPPVCASPGALFAMSGAGYTGAVAFSPDYGASWQTPRLTSVTSVAAGPGCTAYVTRSITTDAFVAKMAPDGTVLWATYLGGSDVDQATALTVDHEGNVYVTGTTSSTDFISTVPRIGTAGTSTVFVTKYTAGGGLLWSALIGGSGANSAAAIAVDGSGSVYAAGRTNSTDFPTTPGALVGAVDQGSYTGFLVKLNADASLAWATMLGPSYTYAGSVLVDSTGAVTLAGNGAVPGLAEPANSNYPAFVVKLDPTGSQVLSSMYIPGSSVPQTVPQVPVSPGTVSLASDAAGNLYVYGATGSDIPVTPGAYNAPRPLSVCQSRYGAVGNAFVMKLAAADWTPIYSAMLRAPCGVVPGGMAVDTAGALVLGLSSGQGLPLRHPLLSGPGCSYYGPYESTALIKLSPDGSTLQYGTYLDNCGPAQVALAPDGSVYVGVTATTPGGPAGVLRLKPSDTVGPSLDGIFNAFSGDGAAVSAGGLYTVVGTGLQASAIVTFDDVPVPVLQVAGGGVVVQMPPVLKAHSRKARGFTLVQVVSNGVASNAVWMPVAARQPGLETKSFPNLPAGTAGGEAYALNADRTVNDAAHPAAAGSTITLFVTGIGGGSPPSPLWTTWDQLTMPPPSAGTPPPVAISGAPGLLPGVYQMRVPVTAAIKQFGQADANGVVAIGLGLQFQLCYCHLPPVSNGVTVYIQ